MSDTILFDNERLKYGITSGISGEILELVRVEEDALYVRDNGKWVMLDPTLDEEEYPTVYNVTYHDVSNDFVLFYDLKREIDLTLQDVKDFIVV